MRKILSTILAVLVIAATSYPSYAQDWEQTNGPNGGAISGLTILGNGTYASIGNGVYYKEAGGIFMTDDNGLNWEPMNNGLLNTNVKTVYAKDTVLFAGALAGYDAADAGVFRSFNGGQTWESCGLTSQSINCFIHQGDYIFAGTSTGGVYRSSDNGNTWVAKNSGLPTGGVQDFAKNNSYIFVVRGSSVLRSANYGDTWTAINTGLPSSGPFRFVVTIASKGDTLYAGTSNMTSLLDGVYISTNNGTNWTLTSLSNTAITELFTRGNDVYAAIPGVGVKKSSDFGVTWDMTTLPVGQNCFTANSENIFSGNPSIGVFHSNDEGQNWNLVDNGMRGQCIRTLGSNSNTIFAGTDRCGLFRTTDNGATWVAANNGIANDGNIIEGLDVFGNNLFLTVYSPGITSTSYRSNDNGENWTALNFAYPLSFYAAIGNTIFASFYNASTYEDTLQIYRSFDAGVTWELTPGLGTGLQGSGRLATISSNLLLFTDNKVYRSVDNANSWTEISTLNGVYLITVCNSKLFCSTTNGIYKSDDLGNTWAYANFPQQAMHLTSNGNKVFAELNREIYATINYGSSWVRIDDETIASTSIFPYVYGYALAATNDFVFTGVGHRSIYKRNLADFVAPSQPSPIVGSVTPCIGSSESYSVTNVPGVTYAWQFPSDWTVLSGNGTNEVSVLVGSIGGIVIVTPSNQFGSGPAQATLLTPSQPIPVNVSIVASSNPSCPGTTVTFTATPINGGSPSYQWFVNLIAVGNDNSQFSYIPENGDEIYVEMTSSLGCVTNNPASSNTIVMSVIACQPWNFTITGQVHTINIPIPANPNINGTPLAAGDWIGVFFIDGNGVEQCGGAVQWNLQGAVLSAYGNDPTTPEKDGFAAGESFRWRMFQASTSTEYPAGATYDATMPNQGNFADFGLSKLTSLQVMICQNYAFSTGWNSISSYINPFDADVEVMFSPVMDELTIMRNLTSIYWPGENINTIGNFNNNSGYALKVTENVDFEICGPTLTGKELTLNQGWSYLPVLSECEVNAMGLFGDHLSDIVIIQDLIGTQVFWPAMNVYTLQTLQPGKAYKMKVSTGFTVTFPECSDVSSNLEYSQVNSLSTPWGELNMTPATQVTAFPENAMIDFAEGDVIGAFGQNGELFGFLQINNTKLTQVMILFGDDATAASTNGFAENENVSFKLYRPSTGEEFSLAMEYDHTMENTSGGYVSGSFASVTKAALNSTAIETISTGNISIYPNPATDKVTITFNGFTNQAVELSIFDTKGQVVISETFSGKTTLDVSSLQPGMYYIRIKSSDLNQVSKFVIK